MANDNTLLPLRRVDYSKLNARAQETYNFQKMSGRLADFGFTCILLSDDWQGADFLALHHEGELSLKVQLKGRMTFQGKYRGKEIYIAFRDGPKYYLYPHDTLRQEMEDAGYVNESSSEQWKLHCNRSWKAIPKKLMPLLKKYELPKTESE